MQLLSRCLVFFIFNAKDFIMKNRKAFTLIELLVVIAIIALLLSIILPALRKVKKQAAAVVCLANMKSFAACWHTYTMDNNEKMVNGHVPRYAVTEVDYWVEAPQHKVGSNYVYTGDNALNGTQIPLEDELYGIRRGLLFPYVGDVDAYHCPANNSEKLFSVKNSWPYGSWWNSYSVTGMMNGERSKETYLIYNPSATSGWDVNAALKISEVVSPGNKIVFLENGDDRGWLMGSWIMNYNPTSSWIDPFAIWHGDQSPLGFADGHAENHRWVDWSTNQNAKFRPDSPDHLAVEYPLPRPDESGDDLRYMRQAYIPGVL